MKKVFTYLLFALLCVNHATGQINIFETFEDGVPADWTTGAASFFGSTTEACTGQSIRSNIWSSNEGTNLTTSNNVAASNATDLNLSFEYKIVDWSAATDPTPPGWGNFNIEYSTDGGNNWVLIDTINDDNHVTSNECATLSYTVDAADLPSGSDFQLRIDISWGGTGFDYYFYLDTIVAQQTTTEPPLCDSVLTTPADEAVDVDIETGLTWTPATGIPTDYILNVGTSSGGNDVVDNVNTGLSPNFSFVEFLEYSTTYFVNILPVNENGEADSSTCQEFSFTTVADPSVIVDCEVGPVNTNFCYVSGQELEFIYTSSNGIPLNLVVNSGEIEEGWDEFIVLDSNGDELYNGYGNGGDLSGLSFQSSGDNITVVVTPDAIFDCETEGYNPIDITVSCATCINPQVEFELIDNCLNAPGFFVEANVLDLGSAPGLDITDNQGSPAQTATEAGVVSFGPYDNGTIVQLTAVNNEDPNCQILSQQFSQEFCTAYLVDCEVGPVNTNFCYVSNEDLEFVYTSSNGLPLNLVVNSGGVEETWDEFIVLDSNGDELYNGYGNNGDLSGLNFQSTGDNITVQVIPDFSNDCQGNDDIAPIDLSVSCASCINPQVEYTVVSDCEDGNEGFFVEVEIQDLGDAPSLDVTNNQGDPLENVPAPTTLTFGPYALGTDVVFTVENVEDVNCTLTSPNLTLDACPPTNDTCDTAEVVVINPDNFCEILNFGTLQQATGSSVPVSCGGPVVQDVWFEFEATATTITSTVLFDGFDGPSHAIYENDCGNLTELYCSEEFDDGGFFDPYSDAIVSENLVIGETYKIRIFSDGTFDDDFELCLTTPQFNEDNTACDISAAFCAPFDEDGNAQPLIFPNGYFYLTETEAEIGPDYGCLGGQPNPAWFFLQVNESGDLAFNITQNSAFNENGVPIGDELDVDFIAYGPFTEQEGNCEDLTAANTVDCSFSAAAVENFTIPDAEAGEYYVLLITNWNQSPGYISLTQTNFGEEGGGSTNCDIVFQNQVAGCQGEDIILTATVTDAVFYQWSVFNEETEEFEPLDGENGMTLTVNTSGLYQVLTPNGTENVTEEFEVTIAPDPELNLPQEISICGSPQVTLDATVLNIDEYDGVSHLWLFEGEIIAGATNPTYEATQTGNYSVVITTTTSAVPGSTLICETQFDVEVLSADFTVDLGGNQNFCSTQTETITATIEGDDPAEATYLWNTGEETPSIDVNTTGTYEVTVTIDGCPITESVIYTFAEEPLFDLGEDLNLCEEETTILDATVENASSYTSVSYQWSDDNGILNGETNPTLNVSVEGNYTVEVITTNTTSDGVVFECSTVESVFVNITEFTVSLGEDLTLCDADAQTITAVVDGEDQESASYLWNTEETTQSITVVESGIYEVIVTINDCPVTASVEYIFNESPIIALGPDSQTCDLTEFTLDATPSNYVDGPINYTWTLDGTVLETDAAIVNPDDFGFGTYEVSVFFDDPTCSTVDDITLSLRDDISVNITSDDIDNLFCVEEVVTFNASLQNAELIEADFQWFVNDEPVGDNSATLENYQITSSEPSQNVRVDVTIGSLCLVSTELPFNLYDLDNCIISQGLSPDTTPGFNDNLDLRFLDDRSGISSLEIFNRYGQRVYEKVNYRDEFFGQSDNGNVLETGTYFYVIKFDNEDDVYGQIHKGWIYINREQ